MRRILVLVGLSALLFLLIISCSNESSDTAATTQDQALVQKASQKLIASYQKTLKGELMSALNTGGSAHAIEVCQKRAPEIGRSATGSPLVTIRRVSERNRNPENAATDEQKAVLARFAADNTLQHVDEWVTIDSVEHYRYYEPIVVQAMCLKCHGPYDLVDDATAATLTSLYPGDKAVDYNVGDLRGMFVVDMEWPAARDYVANAVATGEKAEE